MARFNGGWIKFYREAVENDIGDNVHLLGIWIVLLCWASRFESKIIGPDGPIILPPGTALIGFSELAMKLHVSKKTIHKWIHYLEKRDSISLQGVTRGTIVTICNWTRYQENTEDGVTTSKRQVNAEETTSKRQVTLIGEVEKRRIKEIKKRTLVGIRTEYPHVFQDLWLKYGKRGDKKAALSEWNKINLTEMEIAILHRSVDRYVQNTPELKYRKHFCRYLKTDWREVEPVLGKENERSNWMQDDITDGDETHSRNERLSNHE